MRTLLILLCACYFCGCASATQSVYIPTKCKVKELPKEPRFEGDIYQNLQDLMLYYKLMKPVLHECVEEDNG